MSDERKAYTLDVYYDKVRRRWRWTIFDYRGQDVDHGWNGGENALFQAHENMFASLMVLMEGWWE